MFGAIKETRIANILFYGILLLAEALQYLNGIFYYLLFFSFHYSFSSTDGIRKWAGRMDVLIKSFVFYGCSNFLKHSDRSICKGNTYLYQVPSHELYAWAHLYS